MTTGSDFSKAGLRDSAKSVYHYVNPYVRCRHARCLPQHIAMGCLTRVFELYCGSDINLL